VAVVDALAQMRGEGVRCLLLRTLREDPAGAVRAEAAFALRDFRGPRVEKALVAALDDPSAEVRARAATACGAVCRSPANVEPLTAHALTDPDTGVWWAARATLARMKAEGRADMVAEVDATVRAMAPARLASRDANAADRAALLLADVGDVRGLPRLEVLAVESDDLRTRQQAVAALGALGGASVIAPLRRALQDPSVRPLAFLALQHAAARGIPGAAAALADVRQ
jgi:HEAT repeat protein